MNVGNTPHLKFKGRTYGRPRICQSSRVFDEVVSGETASVTVEGCESFWASCLSEFSRASDPKKGRIDGSESDVSFDGDESQAKPIKMQNKLQGQKLHTQKTEMITIESNSRCSHNIEATAAFCESGMKASPEKSVCLSEENLAKTHVNWRDNDDLSLNHKPHTVKSFLKEVIPDEKPNSPILTKHRRKKRKARARRNFTLNKDHNTNSTKILAGRLRSSTNEAYENIVIPQHKLASENLGTAVSVCKQTSQVAEDKIQTKYFLRNSEYQVIFNEATAGTSQEDLSTNTNNDSVPSATFIAEEVASRTRAQFQSVMEDDSSEIVSTQEIVSTHGSNDSFCSSTAVTEEIPAQTGSQLILFMGDNSSERVSFMGDNSSGRVSTQEIVSTDSSIDSVCSSTEEIAAQTGTQPQNVLFMGDNSQQLMSPPASNSRNPVSPTTVKCITEMDNSNACSVKFNIVSRTSSHDDNCLKSQRPVRKQYRIFKSRSAQIEEKPEAPIFRWEEHDDLPLPSRQLVINASCSSQVTTPVRGKLVSSPPLSFLSAQASDSAEPTPAVKSTSKTINYQHIDGSPVAELPATPHPIGQGTDSEFMSVLDNVPFSEPSSSQETLSNSLEVDSPKSSPAVTVWKFFKSKKYLSQSLDLQKRIFVGSPQKFSVKASYNIRSWNSEHSEDTEEKTATIRKKKKNNNANDVVVLQKPEEGPKLTREMHWPVGVHDEAYTTLTVSKRHRELYTVIQNVRHTHEVQELGETHDFIKEIDYLLESLKETNSNSIRCLSCLQLANKCISPAFRMHMRVHGTVSRIFNLLEDACSDPNLALSTSAIMFVLSRDRLSMDLDHHSLRLMLKLNENDAALDATMPGLEKTRQKVKELLGLLQETYSPEVDLDFVSTCSLALESLLSLTSRRAGEWFKDELRSVGGLDHIVDSVRFCEKNLPDNLSGNIQKSLPVLRKLNRCLRVLENISYMNSENQNYLLSYRNFALLQSCHRTLRLCQLCMPAFKLPENLDNKAAKDLPGHTIVSCILIVLRVMINMTHGNRLANLEEVSLMETVVKCLTTTLWCVPVDQRFDLAVQCLVLLTNLVEHVEENRQIFIDMRIPLRHTKQPLSRTRTVSAVSVVVELFVQREQAAREMEEEIGGISDSSASPAPSLSGQQEEAVANVHQRSRKQSKMKKKQKNPKTVPCGVPAGESPGEHQENQSILEDGEETFTKALHKAGKHMENSIVAAYAAILLGSLVADNKEYTCAVKKLLPKGDFGRMVSVLTKFLRFMVLVTAYDHTDVRLIERVIEVLKSA